MCVYYVWNEIFVCIFLKFRLFNKILFFISLFLMGKFFDIVDYKVCMKVV